MDLKFDELCDNLDAAIFTGDWLASEENQIGLEAYLQRWEKELETWRSLEND